MNTKFLVFFGVLGIAKTAYTADEIHWTVTGQTSVTFDWRGTSAENKIRYGQFPGTYDNEVIAITPNPLPSSSVGPFWEAKITSLQEDTLYYYSIANGTRHTFRTPPPPGYSNFIVYAEGDIGSTKQWSNVADVQKIIGNVYGNGFPDFSLLVGDLTYGDNNGMDDVDQHFNDVMIWSLDAAYMPAWGNHEWQAPDSLNNYEGRFALPNSFTSPGASSVIGNGPDEDWYWFDYGNVRFIAFPELYSSTSRSDWNTKVQPIMAAAQADPDIDFIVTFGHSPAYSCTTGNAELKVIQDILGDNYPEYVLNVAGHHHFYERSNPVDTHHVTHVIAGTGHTNPTPLCTTPLPSWSAFYTKQPGALKLHFTGTGINARIDGEFICAPASSVCTAAGAVVDSFTIGTPVFDNTPPTVSMTAPASGATVSGTATPVSATATDNVGVVGVQFKLDGANLGSQDTAAPYSISWNTTTIANGAHSLTAVARDAAGNTTTSGVVSLTVNNTVPAGASGLTHQWKFDETSGTTALDSAGSNNATLSNALWVAGKTGNAASFNGTNAYGTAGTINFGTGNFTVAHWVKVTAFKNFAGLFNNRSSASGNLGFQTRTDGTSTFTALIDFGATSKSVAITNAVAGTWYHVAVSVDRAGLMKLYVNGVQSGQVDISAFSTTSITIPDTVRIGRDQASVYFNGVMDDLRLYDSALSATDIQNIVTGSNPLPTDTLAPTVSLTAPAANTTVSGTIPVSATAADNVGVAGVQFKLDGVNLGTEDTTAPYAIAWNTPTVANGAHSMTAVARDAAGNTTTSGAVSVTVNNGTSPGPSGLTHQWKFDETSGTTALDSAGPNNATLSNALWVAGKTGNAASFNGTNAYGTAGTINFGTGNFTVAHWVKVTGFKNFAGLFNNRSSASGNLGFQTRTDGTSTFTALIDFGATSKNVAITNAVAGTWYHVAVSVDRAGLMKLYVNGVQSGQVDISAFSTTSITNPDTVRIGRDHVSVYFNGVMDDLRLYNSALSASDILNLYNN